MEAAELQRLRIFLNKLTPEELCVLRNARIPWIPRLRELALHTITEAICEAILDQPFEDRLWCIAWIRCWLMPLQNVRMWHCYRLRTEPALNDCIELLNRLAYNLRIGDRNVTLAWDTGEGVVDACLLTEDAEGTSSEESVVYVVLWHGQPMLAFHSLGRSVRRRVREALRGDVRGRFVRVPAIPHAGFSRVVSAAVGLRGETSANLERQDSVESSGGSAPNGDTGSSSGFADDEGSSSD